MLKRQDILCLSGLFAAVLFFYPELFLAHSASLVGDHLEQHYPWAYWLHQSIRQFHFPFWTSAIHCGFPILAEGQIGAFYPPNLILSLLLPFETAYAYRNIFHFLAAGFGTYAYARRMKLEPFPAFVSAFVFLFGTGYGGAYYNITSLETLAWMPWALLFLERGFDACKKSLKDCLTPGLGIALAVALSLLAGYLQLSLLMILILGCYAGLRIYFFSDKESAAVRLRKIFFFAVSSAIGFLLALPQLLWTFQLAMLSNRTGLTEEYAYVGSMSPLVPLTLLLPNLQGMFRGNSLFVGILPALLILFVFNSKELRKSTPVRIWTFLVIFSLLLALGQWSPVYVALIKLTHFYSFRTPVKFIIFTCFGLSILAGIGFQKLLDESRKKADNSNRAKATHQFLMVLLLFMAAAFLLYYFSIVQRGLAEKWGNWFVDQYVFGKTGHPYSLDFYHRKLAGYLDSLKGFFDPRIFWNGWAYGMLLLHAAYALQLGRLKRVTRLWLVMGFLLLFIDLYVFAWRDIKRDFDAYENIQKPNAIVLALQQEKQAGRLGRIYGFRSPEESLALVPSQNMLYGIEDIGAYSPFVLKRYHETIGQLGNVNDSNFAVSPSEDSVMKRLNLLRALGVSHLLTRRNLNSAEFDQMLDNSETGTKLYRLKEASHRAYFISRFEVMPSWDALKSRFMQEGFDPRENLLFEDSEIQKLETVNLGKSVAKGSVQIVSHAGTLEILKVQNDGPGFLVVFNTYYPGWKVFVNGKESKIVRAYGLFQAVWIESAGQYEVRFAL